MTFLHEAAPRMGVAFGVGDCVLASCGYNGYSVIQRAALVRSASTCRRQLPRSPSLRSSASLILSQ
jgi:hypothetical protein